MCEFCGNVFVFRRENAANEQFRGTPSITLDANDPAGHSHRSFVHVDSEIEKKFQKPKVNRQALKDEVFRLPIRFDLRI